MTKKIGILVASVLLMLGLASNSYARTHWHNRYAWTHCRAGVCHVHVKRCVGGRCRWHHHWHRHYHHHWHHRHHHWHR